MQVATWPMRMALMDQSLLPSGGADLRTETWLRLLMLMLMGHLQMVPSPSMAMLSQFPVVMCLQRLLSGLLWKMQRMRSDLCAVQSIAIMNITMLDDTFVSQTWVFIGHVQLRSKSLVGTCPCRLLSPCVSRTSCSVQYQIRQPLPHHCTNSSLHIISDNIHSRPAYMWLQTSLSMAMCVWLRQLVYGERYFQTMCWSGTC